MVTMKATAIRAYLLLLTPITHTHTHTHILRIESELYKVWLSTPGYFWSHGVMESWRHGVMETWLLPITPYQRP